MVSTFKNSDDAQPALGQHAAAAAEALCAGDALAGGAGNGHGAVALAANANTGLGGAVLYVDGGILAYIGKQPQ